MGKEKRREGERAHQKHQHQQQQQQRAQVFRHRGKTVKTMNSMQSSRNTVFTLMRIWIARLKAAPQCSYRVTQHLEMCNEFEMNAMLPGMQRTICCCCMPSWLTHSLYLSLWLWLWLCLSFCEPLQLYLFHDVENNLVARLNMNHLPVSILKFIPGEFYDRTKRWMQRQ